MEQLTDGANRNTGISWPRLYDILVLIVTRGRDRNYREALLDLSEAAQGMDLLDIGCGTGAFAISAASRVDPGSVTAIDISAPMLRAAQRKARRAGTAISFCRGDAASLPVADAGYDVATMLTVLHMLPESARQVSLRELGRVLRPGGRALIVDYGGPVQTRQSAMARHGRHARFDIYAVAESMDMIGYRDIETGPVGWLDLHYLRARVR